MTRIQLQNSFFLLLLLSFLVCGNVSAINYTSVATGAWQNAGTWGVACAHLPANCGHGPATPHYPSGTGDNATISAGHTVTLGGGWIVNNLTVNATGIIEGSSLVTSNIRITRTLTLNGIIQNCTLVLLLTNDGETVFGTGSCLNSYVRSTAARTIDAAANITVTAGAVANSGNFQIAGVKTITNNGTITLGASLTGINAACTWINAAGSTLNVAGSVFPIGAGPPATVAGVLTASANSNIVNYNGSGAQTIYNTQYWHLRCSNAGTKTPAAALDVDGNLTIQNSAVFSPGALTTTLAGNWVSTSIAADPFVEGTSRVTFNGGAAQTIDRGGRETFYNFTANNTVGGITLNCPITISNSATFTNGVVYSTAANEIEFIDNATVAGGTATSYVDGPVIKIGNDVFVFPTGDNGFWARIGISAPTLVTTEFSAEYFDSAPTPSSILCCREDTISNVSDVEHWILNKNTAPADSVVVTLHYESPARSGINYLDELMVVRYDSGDLLWHGEGTGNYGPVLPAAGYAFTSSPVQNFSPFTFGSPGWAMNPLPVELLYFEVEQKGRKALLKWETATELNNDYFEVQRSKDGVSFQKIGKTAGAGTTSFARQYEFVDEKPLEGVSYYRLKQVDYDGQYAYTDVRPFSLRDMGNGIVLLPNPINNFSDLTINLDELGINPASVYATIHMADGRMIFSGSLTATGKLAMAGELDDAAKGIYLVSLMQDRNFIGSQQILKLDR